MAPGTAVTGSAGERRRSWVWIGALVAIGAAYFGGAVLARGYLFFADITTQDYPFQVFFRECIRAGHLPLWNPYMFGGFPQFAEGQTAALYPPSLLAALFLPAHVAITWLVVLHRVLAGVFMFLLARAWKLPRSSAFIAGLVFMFSGFLFGHSVHWGYSSCATYVPLVLYFLETGLQRRQVIYAVPAGATLALQFLLGAVPIAYLSLFGAGSYVVLRAASLGMRRTIAPAAGLFLGALALGGGLAAVQILPTLALAPHASRTAHPLMNPALPSMLPPILGVTGLVSFIAPNTQGNPAFGDSQVPHYYWERCGYLGLLPLALAFVGAAWQFRRCWVWVAVGLISLALATGQVFDPFAGLVRLMTGAGAFRVPSRYLLIATVSMALLAGVGHDWLRRRARPGGGPWSWLVACCALAAGYAALSFLALPAPARHSLSSAFSSLAPLGVVLLAGSAVTIIAAAWRSALSQGKLTVLATGLILMDVLPWGATQMPTVDGSYFTERPRGAKAIESDKGWFRVVTWRPLSVPVWPMGWHDRETPRALVESLVPNIPASWGIRSLEGYSAFFPHRHGAFLSHMRRLVLTPGELDTRVLDAAGVRYIVSGGPLSTSGVEATCRIREGLWINRNPNALGPCWLVPRAVVAGGLDEANRFLASERFSPAQAAVVEQQVGPLTSAPEEFRGGARAVRLEATRMEFEAWATAPGLLVVNAAAYDPYWRATVSGAPARVYPANVMFQAVWLPPGIHRVIMRYDPLPYVVGRQISLASLALLVVGLVWRRVRR